VAHRRSVGIPQRGELFWSQFPYAEDPTRSKARPVCVVSSFIFNSGSPDILIAKVTSSERRWAQPRVGDVPLQDWVEAGLPVRSVVRAGSLVTVAATRLTGPFGALSARDLIACDDALRVVLQLPQEREREG
jgi:mRNA-degrading endonuclease toxin of MazEF toxin-antitoxin module